MDTFCSEEIGKPAQARLKVRRQRRVRIGGCGQSLHPKQACDAEQRHGPGRRFRITASGSASILFPSDPAARGWPRNVSTPGPVKGRSVPQLCLPGSDSQGERAWAVIRMPPVRRYALSAMPGIVTEKERKKRRAVQKSPKRAQKKAATAPRSPKKTVRTSSPHGQHFRGSQIEREEAF